MTVGRPVALLLALVLFVSGCARGGDHQELTVGSTADSDSRLLAALYVSALRSYGFPTRAETAADPMAKLDSGAFAVIPAYTGSTLRSLQPDAKALSDKQVYQAMNAALPEGVAAGDYATAAEDKPTLVVAPATAQGWGGSELSLLAGHCAGVGIGRLAGWRPPSAVGACRLPAAREFADAATMFAALRAGEITAAWTTSADPAIPSDLTALADSGKNALIQAENVVPLYRRNALNTRQLLAINEIAGVLDTAALAELRGKAATGADPQAVADAWLGEHPLGR